jgi:hypothetical protein
MSQCERLLCYLRDHETIDPFTAWRQLGIYRLASRICELRGDGEPIVKEMREVENRFGETTKVAFYRLERND